MKARIEADLPGLQGSDWLALPKAAYGTALAGNIGLGVLGRLDHREEDFVTALETAEKLGLRSRCWG